MASESTNGCTENLINTEQIYGHLFSMAIGYNDHAVCITSMCSNVTQLWLQEGMKFDANCGNRALMVSIYRTVSMNCMSQHPLQLQLLTVLISGQISEPKYKNVLLLEYLHAPVLFPLT